MADSHSDPDRGDPSHRRTRDPDLQKAKEDTAQVFIEYARLSASAVERDQSSPTESESPSLTKQCLQLVHDGNSRNGAAVVGPSTLPRQKSSETATRKDPHPKAVYSTRQPAQIVSNPHCSVGESSTHPVPPGSTSTRSNRPDKLSLSGRGLKRIPSATGSDNGSSGKTTPAQDPPMELMSPGTELSASYPLPPSSSSTDRNREWLNRSADHATATATAAAASSSQASCTTSQEKERHFPAVDKGADPRAVKARMIADRLKSIGDDLESEYGRTKLEDLATAISDLVLNSNLSWRRVAEIFKLLCKVMETRTRYDDQFSLFEKAWYCLLDSVVPWIQHRGGWAALPRETGPVGLTNTPDVHRRQSPHQLNPAQSEPVLLLDNDHLTTTNPPLCQPLNNIGASSTLGRRVSEASGGGRPMITYTPQMPRHHYGNYPHAPPPSREQSSPCLSRDRSNSQHSQHSQAESTTSAGQGGRSRLWSLTESGSFKREEDGLEDIEQSISELDMTVHDEEEGEEEGEESEAFVASQEGEGEGDGESQQEAEKTLTSITFHASASFSSRSPPIIVPSPHSSSQPETISMDEFPIDSGIDASSLSLSGSPRGLHFTVPPRHIETSFTSLSSAASASPIHTSPSSRKNSSNGGGYFSDKTRPRSGGSLKESSRGKHGGSGEGESPQCYRGGSLRSSRSRPRYPRHPVTTPTNGGTPSQSAASSGHGSSWMQTPVRRMSTNANTIYEMVKDFFSP